MVWQTDPMALKMTFELTELLIANGYLLLTWRKEQPVTKGLIVLAMLMLAVDIFLLHGEKPGWAWVLMNIPASIIIYEKVTRQTVVVVAKKLAAVAAMLFG